MIGHELSWMAMNCHVYATYFSTLSCICNLLIDMVMNIMLRIINLASRGVTFESIGIMSETIIVRMDVVRKHWIARPMRSPEEAGG